MNEAFVGLFLKRLNLPLWRVDKKAWKGSVLIVVAYFTLNLLNVIGLPLPSLNILTKLVLAS